jgi:hypothetical protein
MEIDLTLKKVILLHSDGNLDIKFLNVISIDYCQNSKPFRRQVRNILMITLILCKKPDASHVYGLVRAHFIS